MKLRCPCCNKKIEIRLDLKAVKEEKGIPVPPSGQPMNTEACTYNYPALGQFDDVDGI